MQTWLHLPSDSPRKRTVRGAAGRAELLLCPQSGDPGTRCPSLPQHWPRDTPQGAATPEKTFWVSGVFWLVEFTIAIFQN